MPPGSPCVTKSVSDDTKPIKHASPRPITHASDPDDIEGIGELRSSKEKYQAKSAELDHELHATKEEYQAKVAKLKVVLELLKKEDDKVLHDSKGALKTKISKLKAVMANLKKKDATRLDTEMKKATPAS